MKTWEEEMQHEATRGYYECLRQLTKNVSGLVLEIGVAEGISTHAFLDNPLIHLISVDKEDDAKVAQAKSYNKQGMRWLFRNMSSDEFFIENTLMFDGVFVDGDHRYEQVKKDMDYAWEALMKDGLLICHDVCHEGNWNSDYGTSRALTEFIYEYNVPATIYPPYPCLSVIKKP